MRSMCLDNTEAGTGSRRGLVGWLIGVCGSRARFRDRSMRRMQLLETLAIGGKRQLALVRCGDEQFLIGLGAETVSTIVKVGSGESEKGR